MNMPAAPAIQAHSEKLARRHLMSKLFRFVCFSSTLFAVLLLFLLLGVILWQGAGWVNWNLLTEYDSRHPEQAGILAGLWGSMWLLAFTVLFSIPIGVGAAIYLEEYAASGRMKRLIQINLANLAGVPSIVYGILGLTVFVKMFGLFQSNEKVIEISLWFATIQIPLPFDRTVISGALTLSLLILPVVIVASQEALRAVPSTIRHASLALGATRWQTIRHHVLPSASPGILTGVILALSRAIGETAPLVMIGALTYVAFTPGGITSPVDFVTNPEGALNAPFSSFTALPLQIFNWASQPKADFQHVAAAGILVLLAVLFVMNGIAVFIRYRFQQRTES